MPQAHPPCRKNSSWICRRFRIWLRRFKGWLRFGGRRRRSAGFPFLFFLISVEVFAAGLDDQNRHGNPQQRHYHAHHTKKLHPHVTSPSTFPSNAFFSFIPFLDTASNIHFLPILPSNLFLEFPRLLSGEIFCLHVFTTHIQNWHNHLVPGSGFMSREVVGSTQGSFFSFFP